MFKKENYRIAFDVWGLVLFLVIMLPNFIWFAVPAVDDVLREESVTPFADTIASVFQIIMVASLCILVNKDRQKHGKSVLCGGVIASIILYDLGWVLYYAGIVNAVVILDLCIAPCFAFILFSISRKNGVALFSAGIFTVCHILYGVVNFVL